MVLDDEAAGWIRRERARRGWGLRTAAAKAGVSVGVWQRAETGGSVEYASVVKLVAGLGYEPERADQLIAGELEPPPDPEPTDPGGGGALAQEVAELREQVDELTGLLKAALSGDTSRLFVDQDDEGTARPQPPPVDPDDVA